MSSALDFVRYSCGIAGEEVANYLDSLEKQIESDSGLIDKLRQQNAELTAQLEAAQAKIDSLMQEYCPDEMTPEQKKVWADNQVKDGE